MNENKNAGARPAGEPAPRKPSPTPGEVKSGQGASIGEVVSAELEYWNDDDLEGTMEYVERKALQLIGEGAEISDEEPSSFDDWYNFVVRRGKEKWECAVWGGPGIPPSYIMLECRRVE